MAYAPVISRMTAHLSGNSGLLSWMALMHSGLARRHVRVAG
jgi:hypothetical protein